MKRIYFISVLALALIISSGLVFAATDPVKPANLNCNLSENFDNEWCDLENGGVDNQDVVDEPDTVSCDPYFVVTPKYKGYAIKYIEDTKKLQTLLMIDNDAVVLTVDGLWGPKTDKAFRAFQKSNDLTVTGKVDDETIAFLQENYCDANTGGQNLDEAE